MRKEYLFVAIFSIMTAVTVYSSVYHHIHIAETYGPIANVFVPTIAICSFLLGAVISMMFQWGINIIQFEKVVKLLADGESSVVRALFRRGQMTQAEIVSETGVSKATVSRAISSLENQGLISRKSVDNQVWFIPKLKSLHPEAEPLTRFSGLTEQRVLIAVILLFIFGISLSLLNSYHVTVLGHPLEMSLYLLAIEFFALGAAFILLMRRRISDIQLEKTLSVLPDEERKVLRIIHSRKMITQNELVDASGIYKMKISRLLAKFESQDIIEKRPYGYTNIIRSKL